MSNQPTFTTGHAAVYPGGTTPRLTTAAIKEVEQREKTPRSEAAWNAYVQSASLIPLRDEMRKLEAELIAEREQRQLAGRVAHDALDARNLAERERDIARAQRDRLKAMVADAITQLQNGAGF